MYDISKKEKTREKKRKREKKYERKREREREIEKERKRKNEKERMSERDKIKITIIRQYFLATNFGTIFPNKRNIFSHIFNFLLGDSVV